MFKAKFGQGALAMSIGAILILLFFGLQIVGFAQGYWVAFAFWTVGFFGSLTLGITHRVAQVTATKLMYTVLFTGVVLLGFVLINYAYAVAIDAQSTVIADKAISTAIGISEELFFGVFLLGVMINMGGLPRPLAVVISAGVHASYHMWLGVDVALLWVFFISFSIARTVYVYIFPHADMLLGAHGFWNLWVT